MIAKSIKSLLFLMALLTAGQTWALDLDEAKARGLVGEKLDGFVAAVDASPGAEVKALVADTNKGRRKLYEELAQRNQITVEQVGILSHEKLRERASPGEYLQSSSGGWAKK